MAQAHILIGTESDQSHLTIRHIGPADLKDALVKGWDDFCAMPSHALFLCVMYPIIGIAIAGFTLGYSFLPLLLSAGGGLCADRADCRDGPLRAEPPARGRSRSVGGRRARRAAARPRIGAIVAIGVPADAAVPDLDRDRECDLRGEFRLRGADVDQAIRQRRADDARRLEADRARQRHRLFVRGRGARSSASCRFRCCSTATSAQPSRSPRPSAR